ncbi:hypothetical protein ACH347_26460 [Saccharopolyspora sp. 5N102]|uniref:hypothetical protein n=1 Tax=Saccharopolyspora sp. 5N102 TaxID=3375155 RepID=UPI0037A7280F
MKAATVVPGRPELSAAAIDNELMLDDDVVLGSANADLSHYNKVVQALAGADRNWPGSLISRRIPLGDRTDAFETGLDDAKVVVDLQA